MSMQLECYNLAKTYETKKGPFTVFQDFNLKVRTGEFVSIIGHSGCGKSTVLSMIAGLNSISEGAVMLAGREIDGPGPDRGVVFQAPCLLPWMTALGNVQLGVDQVFPRATKTQRRQIAMHYLDQVGLANAANKRPSELSQGMRQRVGIARAFALEPKMLLLDEPSFGLAPLIVVEIYRILREINEQDKVSMLLVEQNASIALELAKNAYLLETGRVAVSGPSEMIKGDESIRRAYLGY